MLKYIPIIVQIFLVPISIIFCIIMIKDKPIELLSGLTTFSAVLTALSYSAARAASDGSEEKRRYMFSGRCFFESTIASSLAFVFNYALIHPEFSFGLTIPLLIRFYYIIIIYIFYGTGLVAAHFALWDLTKIFYKDF